MTNTDTSTKRVSEERPRLHRMRLVGNDNGTGTLVFEPLSRWEAFVWHVRAYTGLPNPSGIVSRPLTPKEAS